MRNVPAALLAHLQGETTTTAICWFIEKRDGTFIRGTDHDEDIEIPPTGDSPEPDYVGRYYAMANITVSDSRRTLDAGVDNSEVVGALEQPGSTTIDVSVADLEAGLFDGAPVVQLLVNWADESSPPMGVDVFYKGYLGEVSRDSDRKYTTELRGLKQVLTQIFVRTYSESCQVKRFGDDECKFPLETQMITGTVTAVTNSKRFDATLDLGSPAPAAAFYNGGELTFTTGANAGYMREVKRDDNDDVQGHMSFWERFPNDPQVGDEFELTPGCARTKAACQAYDNFVNYRGYGILITGVDALLRGAGV